MDEKTILRNISFRYSTRNLFAACETACSFAKERELALDYIRRVIARDCFGTDWLVRSETTKAEDWINDLFDNGAF